MSKVTAELLGGEEPYGKTIGHQKEETLLSPATTRLYLTQDNYTC